MERLSPVANTPSITDRVASSLRDAITTLQLEPGSPVVEATVARHMGVSTTPVREAFQRLANEGLLVLNRYRGASVVKLSVEDVKEIAQLREVLEPLAVRLAVPRFSPDDVAAMGELLERAGQAIDERNWNELSRCNRAFHGMFFAWCGSLRLQSILENLQDQNRIIALQAWQHRGFQRLEHDEHLAIFRGVQAGDPEAAAVAARAHLTRFGQAICDAWMSFETASPR